MHLVTWVSTPLVIVRKMLSVAQVSLRDTVYDLGSGDGRVLVTAVRDFGAIKAIGYEIREDLYEIAEREVTRLNLGDRITMVKGDLFDADLSGASVITLYLSSETNEILRPVLEKRTKLQSRVVTYLFPINGWRTTEIVDLQSFSFAEGKFVGMLYLYRIPEAFQ